MRSLPGFRWRFLAHARDGYTQREEQFRCKDALCFDELVIDDWFHIEQMDKRRWWLRVADRNMHVVIPHDGPAHITLEWRDREEDAA